ncbi:MAG: thymidine kinase [Candidatus Hodarchaeales archaeon]
MTPLLNPYSLEIVVGNMYAGKSSELIKRALAAKELDIPFHAFKPVVDNRSEDLFSKDGLRLECDCLESPKDILTHDINHSLVLIDEVQFFDESIIYAIQYLVQKGNNVFVAGLDRDFRGQPFIVTSQLMVLADKITKLYSYCSIDGCKNKGTRTQRLRNGKPDSLLSKTVEIEYVAENIDYIAVCEEHHLIPDFKEYLEKNMG